jgi:prolyl oligopeptidase PreP (S9A serine peptidase family)
MVLGFHYSQYYSNAYALNQYFASKGYVVMSLNYRSGIGYGLEFREALNYGAAGASEVKDLLAAGENLKSRVDVDGSRIALWGGSYGVILPHTVWHKPRIFLHAGLTYTACTTGIPRYQHLLPGMTMPNTRPLQRKHLSHHRNTL